MKTISAFLHWFNWSSMDSYQLPKSLCSAFWSTIVNLILFFVCWPMTIINLIWYALSYEDVKFGSDDYATFPNILGLLFSSIPFLLGFVTVDVSSKGENWLAPEFMSDWNFLQSYFFIWGVGALVTVVITLIILASFGVYKFFEYIFKSIFRKKVVTTDQSGASYEDEEPSRIAKLLGAMKNKYCPRIDWSRFED